MTELTEEDLHEIPNEDFAEEAVLISLVITAGRAHRDQSIQLQTRLVRN